MNNNENAGKVCTVETNESTALRHKTVSKYCDILDKTLNVRNYERTRRKQMKINVFYLIVGILCVSFAITHTWNGLDNFLQVLNNTGIDGGTKTVCTYYINIILEV
jgi:hypothetical protein